MRTASSLLVSVAVSIRNRSVFSAPFAKSPDSASDNARRVRLFNAPFVLAMPSPFRLLLIRVSLCLSTIKRSKIFELSTIDSLVLTDIHKRFKHATGRRYAQSDGME